ncbi:MAG TPA: hypothetical protein VK789_15210 [Bryobacteraceae bacterium]|nr:hypothetical protein [Bryobacteraceae bacterium]
MLTFLQFLDNIAQKDVTIPPADVSCIREAATTLKNGELARIL